VLNENIQPPWKLISPISKR